MRRFAGGLAALVLLLGHAAMAEGTTTDWVLIRLVAGAGGASNIKTTVTATATIGGRDPALVGIGFADRWVSAVDIAPVGAGPLRFSTTAGAGSVDVLLQEGPDPRRYRIETRLSYDDILDANTSVSLLVFTPGMQLDDAIVTPPSFTAGDVRVHVYTGNGSKAIAASDPGDAGMGASAGPAAVAIDQVHEAEPDVGIVGAFVTLGFCAVCEGTWSSPVGEVGATSTVDGVAVSTVTGRSTFAGPAGPWSWTWSGSGLNRALAPSGRFPAFAAYAPVGDAWLLFHGFAF